MKPELSSDKTIYKQIAESIEDDILQGMIEEESQIPSTNQLAVHYRINPATARMGITLLVDQHILYKKRGIGMFVSKGAVQRIKDRRKKEFETDYIQPLIKEAQKLDITLSDLTVMISRNGANSE